MRFKNYRKVTYAWMGKEIGNYLECFPSARIVVTMTDEEFVITSGRWADQIARKDKAKRAGKRGGVK